ncbi:MAG: methyltransferase domain-containing protein [Acidimicrobiales bacterium]
MEPAPDIYTHGYQEAVLRAHRWRTAANSAGYLLAHIGAGQRLLDVGCGPGTLTCDLGRAVAPGEVIGVDLSAAVVAEAAAHAAALSVANVSFVVGDFRSCGLDRQSFDVVHAHQVLQHLADPVAALAAMADLVRPGGLLAARDSDYSALTWFPATEALDRWREVYLAVTGRNLVEADAGRWLLRWATLAGLSRLQYSTSTWTFATPADRTWWASIWAARCVDSSFAEQAVAYGIATADEMATLAEGWRAWAMEPEAVLVILHGEILAWP